MKNYSKYMCIFGGGAVRGYCYLGVIKAFEEKGFCPEKLAGSSVGAVFATLYALGVPLIEMHDIFFNINFELFRDINFKMLSAFSISKGGVFLDWLREIIERYYYKESYIKGQNQPVCFKDIDRDLYIVATNLTDETPFVFSKETTPDYEIAMAVRASTGLPGLLTPVKYNDKYLADGDLLKSNPIWRLDKILSPEDLRILEIRLEGTFKDSDVKNVLDYFSKIYNCIVNYSTDFIIDSYNKKDKFDYIKINTGDLAWLNFNVNKDVKTELINTGYDATMNFFDNELPLKREKLLSAYQLLNNKFQLLKTCVSKNNIKTAKEILGDVFKILTDINKIIDRKFHKEIKATGDLFDKNIEYGLFKQIKLKNKKLILAEIEYLSDELMDKCKNLSCR